MLWNSGTNQDGQCGFNNACNISPHHISRSVTIYLDIFPHLIQADALWIDTEQWAVNKLFNIRLFARILHAMGHNRWKIDASFAICIIIFVVDAIQNGDASHSHDPVDIFDWWQSRYISNTEQIASRMRWDFNFATHFPCLQSSGTPPYSCDNRKREIHLSRFVDGIGHERNVVVIVVCWSKHASNGHCIRISNFNLVISFYVFRRFAVVGVVVFGERHSFFSTGTVNRKSIHAAQVTVRCNKK